MSRLWLLLRFPFVLYQVHFWSIWNDPDSYKKHVDREIQEFKRKWREEKDDD